MNFNLRDQIRDKETDPLQFKYIPANCRLYYKLSNAYNMPNLWHDVANANWNDQSLCVPGSTTAADDSITPPSLTTIAVIPPLVNWPVNDTELASVISDGSGGLQDGGDRNSGMTECDASCSCQTISFRCASSAAEKPKSVCLQKCTQKTASSCQQGTHFVSTGVKSISDSKSFGVERRAVPSTGYKQDVHGVCTPTGTFVQKTGLFGCPISPKT